MEDQIYRRYRQRVSKKLKSVPDLSPKERLALAKDYLRQETHYLKRQHRKGESGGKLVRSRAMVMDVLIESIYDAAQKDFQAETGPPPCEVCLVALGGYGRTELSPLSDIDIMFLFPDRVRSGKLNAYQKKLTESILYILWDLNLKVGHSTRTIREAIEEGRNDILTKNALLESRRITGSSTLFQQFYQAYLNISRKDAPRNYIKIRLADQEARRDRYGKTVFLQEPDIKNGVGGLRDYQNILWMSRIKLATGDVEKLLEQKYLNETEYIDFTSAYDFLLRVRNELHFQSKRPTDVLNLEKQPSVASYLGYEQEDVFLRVEAFMKDYYGHAQNIFRISKILERRFALANNTRISFKAIIKSRLVRGKSHIDGFLHSGETLSSDNAGIFIEDPERLIRIFRHGQQLNAKIEFDLECLIRESLHLITDEVIHSQTANRSFRSILQTAGNVYPALDHMHELGVLSCFLPEFKKLTCLVQHEYYHRYTADVHTLRTIRELDSVVAESGSKAKKYRRALHNTSKPTLLYLVLLLHDIGKGFGIEGHARKSEEMAQAVLERLNIKQSMRETILFVIRNHLEMARFWQRFDIDDTRSCKKFARFIQNDELLRYLYVHTYCDAMGTAHGMWNEYKDMLHSQLFYGTLKALTGKAITSASQRKTYEMTTKEEIRKRIPDIIKEEIDAHYNLLPDRYFIQQNADEVALHISMINTFLKTISHAESLESLMPVIDWQDDLNLSLSVVNIITWDRAGVFSKLAGAISLAGASIVSSKMHSRKDNIAIDTFYICEPNGGVIRNKKAPSILRNHLKRAFLKDADFMPEILNQAKTMEQSAYLRKEDTLKAPIPPIVDVYHDHSLHRTIIEIQANDQIGLLYRLSRTIFEEGFDITFARISTEKKVAVDTFYIDRIDKSSTGPEENLIELRNALTVVIDSKKGNGKKKGHKIG